MWGGPEERGELPVVLSYGMKRVFLLVRGLRREVDARAGGRRVGSPCEFGPKTRGVGAARVWVGGCRLGLGFVGTGVGAKEGRKFLGA